MEENFFLGKRQEMVREQLVKRGIADKRMLDAFLAVPRHQFVPEDKRRIAYDDSPVAIGEGQTISQPYMVALMTQALGIEAGQRALEIGVGSGYQAAILAQMGAKVFAVERVPALMEQALVVLKGLGYEVTVSLGDGTMGWTEFAPYDRIIVSAAAPSIPAHLVEQLACPGRLVLPLGGPLQQSLTVIEKDAAGLVTQESLCSCIFVPLIGRFGYSER